jgi:D-lyxose ketol-isomerase
MKRSEINEAVRSATRFFQQHHWHLPPNPAWDVTDFGLGDFGRKGLVLINLAEEPEYCEKLMYARQNQETPLHCHAKKKEDIIVRVGSMAIELWNMHPEKAAKDEKFEVQVNRQMRQVANGETLELLSGERITLVPGVYHAFYPTSNECIIGEVSTANDDTNDNFFVDKRIGRYAEIEEDEEALVNLISDK